MIENQSQEKGEKQSENTANSNVDKWRRMVKNKYLQKCVFRPVQVPQYAK